MSDCQAQRSNRYHNTNQTMNAHNQKFSLSLIPRANNQCSSKIISTHSREYLSVGGCADFSLKGVITEEPFQKSSPEFAIFRFGTAQTRRRYLEGQGHE